MDPLTGHMAENEVMCAASSSSSSPRPESSLPTPLKDDAPPFLKDESPSFVTASGWEMSDRVGNGKEKMGRREDAAPSSLAAENARLTMLLHEQLGVTRAMEQQVAELGARWGERRSAYEAQISKLDVSLVQVGCNNLQITVCDGFPLREFCVS